MMADSTISSKVTISVTLGSAAYPSPLTITPAGFIDPSAGGFDGATGLVATIAVGAVLNQGTIAGGVGGTLSTVANNGGIGVDLTGGSLSNTGDILGGGAGYFSLEAGVSGVYGGTGIVVASGSVTNSGTILGGAGGNAALVNANGGFDGGGGVGAILTSSSLTNSGVIGGGSAVGYWFQASAGGAGVDATGSSLTNLGTILAGNGAYGGVQGGGAGGAGVSLTAGSTLTNMGTIFGGKGGGANTQLDAEPGANGIGVYVSASSLTNAGEIAGGGGGVSITNGGLTNSDVIDDGIAATNGVVFNSGEIDGEASNTGAYLRAGSVLTNQGTINGGSGGVLESEGPGGPYFSPGGYGVVLKDSALVNDGAIIGGLGVYRVAGVYLSGGLLTNNGYIYGVVASDAIVINNGSITGGSLASGTLTSIGGSDITLVNSGTINGQAAFTGGTNRLIDDPGGVFIGGATSSPTASTTLELASGASIGTISGIGTSFTGFGTITVDRNASWVVNGSVTGTGTFSLGESIHLDFNSSVAATRSVYLGDYGINDSVLGVGDQAGFAATVYDFQPGDAFDFTSITSTGGITAGVNASNDLTLTSGGLLLAGVQLDPTQNFSGVTFQATPDGATGTLVTEVPLCFLAGTLIATPSGEVPVEQLRVGDLVLTARGEARPVVWIGAGQVLATRGRRSPATPVIVRKGALGDNVPHHDLRVTKAHALGVDGALIPVEFLVNHRSILWDDQAQEVALYHVELASHDVLLANGAPAESYRDDGNRWLFHNANSGWGLAAQQPCAPILTGGPVVDAAGLRLLRRAGPGLGVPLTDDPDLHLLVDGGRVVASCRTERLHVFELAAVPDGAHIASRAAAPQELCLARDPRLLGVAVRRIIIRQGKWSRTIEAEDARLTHGFHAFEAKDGWRWTDGDAHLPAALFAGFDGPLEVELLCGGTTRYVAEGVVRRAA
jgi:hypothetical protein